MPFKVIVDHWITGSLDKKALARFLLMVSNS